MVSILIGLIAFLPTLSRPTSPSDPVALRALKMAAMSVKAWQVATLRLPIEQASCAFQPPCRVIEAAHHDYIKCDGTPLILIYQKDGKFHGLEAIGVSQSGIVNYNTTTMLQGHWRAKGVYITLPAGGWRHLTRLPYAGVIVDGNVLAYGTSPVPVSVLFLPSKLGRYKAISPTYPTLEDRADVASNPMTWTAPRVLIPLWSGVILTLCEGGGSIELAMWLRQNR